ncbi:MAG: hypothetical protein KIT33_02860 [Candidatus Kapabacteria bacterium]|nr:hypothetical protein [Ignavibacteriota bacterium]MCW5883890.1 hypothetical protein [Candidatus Kapabacteria bacterium]
MKKFIISILFIFIYALSFQILRADENPENKKSDKKVSQFKMTKSTGGAIWRSLAVPGWGQVYVESYWKAPIFFVASGTLVYFIIDNQLKFNDYDNRLSALEKGTADYNLAKSYREFYRDNRDMSGFYFLAVYILAAVDAYVGAHLYDFQVDDNLSMNFNFAPLPIPAVSIRIKF